MSLRIPRLLLLGLAAVAAGAVLYLCNGINAHSAAADATAKDPISAVSAEQREAFSALRQPATAAVPALLRQFTDQNGPRFNPNPDLARQITVPSAEGTWYVIPGNTSVCLFETPDNAGTCTSLDDAKAGRLYLQLVKPPPTTKGGALPGPGEAVQSTIVGLAPDGAGVAARTLAGASANASVSNGLYSVVGTDVTGVNLTGASETALPVIAGPR